jgi:hypothetical protein
MGTWSVGFSPQGGATLQDDPAIAYSLVFVHGNCKCTRSCFPLPASLAPLSQEPLTKTDAQLVAEALVGPSRGLNRVANYLDALGG